MVPRIRLIYSGYINFGYNLLSALSKQYFVPFAFRGFGKQAAGKL